MCTERRELLELRRLPGAAGLRLCTRGRATELPSWIPTVIEMKHAEAKARVSVTRYGLWSLAVVSLVLLVGCGEDGATVPRGPGGTGASGGVGATGGNGTGGVVGTGGMLGTGGMVGTGGTVGTGGMVGTGGTGGPCATNALCHTCPDRFLCDTDDNCTFSGDVCVDSGCDTLQGAAIKQCVPSWGGSCANVNECPNSTDYECKAVGAGGTHCVRVTGGCDPVTESYDCVPGFSCEGQIGQETCIDRRVPCDTSFDCPKSHVCQTTPVSKYCVRVHRTCRVREDCTWLGVSVGEFCADVDADGRTECVGDRDGSGSACVNSVCGGSVCQSAGILATCGDYGLCFDENDCGTGFSCVGLWQDGRKECVPTPGPGDCDQVTQCPLQQVCAAPRNGGPPSCQAGSVP
jgi:hypothetical protein